MFRAFCDFCGIEITAANSSDKVSRFTVGSKGDSVEYGIGLAVNVEEDHHCCKYCIIDTIIRLDDRPQPERCRDD